MFYVLFSLYPIYVSCERVLILEGDMLRYEETSVAGTLRSALADVNTRWRDAELVYAYDPDSKFTRSEKRQLEAAMVEIKENTCVVFREKEEDDEDYVLLFKPKQKGCQSFVGRQGGEQKILLHGDCFQRKTLVHEIMHALGFIHEHTRSDRDEYITVLWDNMAPQFKKDFEKRDQSELTLLDTPYSYNSVMHYSGLDSSSINGRPVMVPKRPGVTLGPLQNKLSDIDILRINRLYHCGTTTGVASTRPTTRAPQTRRAVWLPGAEEISWAPLCDFTGNDIAKVLGPGEECGGHCSRHPQCTHFTWSKIDGGTCFMKAGVPQGRRPFCLDPTVWVGAVCGFVGTPIDKMLKLLVLPVTVYVMVDPNKLTNTTTKMPRADPCADPLKIGEPLDELNSTIKYYFDSQLSLCFPYGSKGGYDGLNSFETEKTCRSKCVSQDGFACGGNAPSTGSCNAANSNARVCPVGSICKKGPFTSMCCPQETEVAFRREFQPKCREGMVLVTKLEQYGDDAFRGRNCSHNFCPEGAECRQGHWISHCCMRAGEEKKVSEEKTTEGKKEEETKTNVTIEEVPK